MSDVQFLVSVLLVNDGLSLPKDLRLELEANATYCRKWDAIFEASYKGYPLFIDGGPDGESFAHFWRAVGAIGLRQAADQLEKGEA